ncbi:hypothetical protein QTP86_009741 [Hemibagrus guttatus]|nr:hypothetical protein QTP86_009741 [Hemibagrus guttatus]
MPINLQCMSLDWGMKPEYPEKTPKTVMEIPFSGFELLFVVLAVTVFCVFGLSAIYTRSQHADNQVHKHKFAERILGIGKVVKDLDKYSYLKDNSTPQKPETNDKEQVSFQDLLPGEA